jgi:hypothetical protein
MAGSTIFLTTTKPRIERAPTWGDIAGEAYLSELYDHYGCQPFWSEGYREPDWARSD